MSGSGAQKRSDALARKAYKMSQFGYTHRDIAVAVGKRPEQIKNLVAKGERLASVTTDDTATGIEAVGAVAQLANRQSALILHSHDKASG